MKKIISVNPCKRVGEVAFGMPRDLVRKTFGNVVREFMKTKFSRNTTDDFGFAHVYYNGANECIAVEVFDDCIVTVEGDCLLPCDQASFNAWLKAHDTQANIQDCESTSVSLSIGATAANGKIESILFGTSGYYSA